MILTYARDFEKWKHSFRPRPNPPEDCNTCKNAMCVLCLDLDSTRYLFCTVSKPRSMRARPNRVFSSNVKPTLVCYRMLSEREWVHKLDTFVSIYTVTNTGTWYFCSMLSSHVATANPGAILCYKANELTNR